MGDVIQLSSRRPVDPSGVTPIRRAAKPEPEISASDFVRQLIAKHLGPESS
jgi:hypothetical protein